MIIQKIPDGIPEFQDYYLEKIPDLIPEFQDCLGDNARLAEVLNLSFTGRSVG